MTDDAQWHSEAMRMVEGLGPLPSGVVRALLSVPRHRFVPAPFRSRAYDDEPLPVGRGETTISAPHMVAFQLEWAELAPGHVVLEVGSGTGYLLALLAEATGPNGVVHGIELDPLLGEASRRSLASLGYDARVSVHIGDGAAKMAGLSSFDRILVSCASPGVFRAWRDELVDGGILVAPVGDHFAQTLVRLRRSGQSESREEGPRVRFVPLRTSRRPDI